MNERTDGSGEWYPGLVEALAGLAEPAPTEFELRILRYVGIPEDRYDTYVYLDVPARGLGLYVAQSEMAVTGAQLSAVVPTAKEFEVRHRARTGRSAVRATAPRAGVRTAIRTGRAKQLRIDMAGLTELERAVLRAIRGIPRGQTRPISWVVREAELPDSASVLGALARNPVHLLLPCHRVTYDNGRPCDAAYGPAGGKATTPETDTTLTTAAGRAASSAGRKARRHHTPPR